MVSSAKSLLVKTIIYSKFLYKLYVHKPIIVLVWHQVSSTYIRGYHNEHDWTSEENFRESLRFLIKKGFRFISLTEAHRMLTSGEKRDRRYVVVTFDDGYATLRETFPILEKHKIPATFFINTAYLDGTAAKWADIENLIVTSNHQDHIPGDVFSSIELLKNNPAPEQYDTARKIAERSYYLLKEKESIYLTKEELFSMVNPLFSFALHGHEHEHHTLMAEEWCRENILKNRKILKDHPNFIPYLAFPFGNYSEEEVAFWESSGIKTLGCQGLWNKVPVSPLKRSSIDNNRLTYWLMASLSGENFSLKKALWFKNNNHHSH